MALRSLGHSCDEDQVNAVMGAQPMRGAAWEQVLACAQHYGCRSTLTTPATIKQLKDWTDAGIPVMIAWNPEGREWSHASVVFDVEEHPEHGYLVHVADPNIPDPDETVRIVPKSEFYSKWYEKWPNYLVRRPACAIAREVSQEGRQLMASLKGNGRRPTWLEPSEGRPAMDKSAKKPTPVTQKQDRSKVRGEAPAERNVLVQQMLERSWGSGKHRSRGLEEKRGEPPKHKKDPRSQEYMSQPSEEAMWNRSARFEEGKPADPTSQMSEEDAKKWEEMNDKFEDKFKKAWGPTIYQSRAARFLPGEEGRKQFEQWKSEQPEDFQEEWDKMNEEHGEKFKTARRSLTAAWGETMYDESCWDEGAADPEIEVLLEEDADPTSHDQNLASTWEKASSLEGVCWEGYEAYGMKEKDGRQVPNCVPVKKKAGRRSSF